MIPENPPTESTRTHVVGPVFIGSVTIDVALLACLVLMLGVIAHTGGAKVRGRRREGGARPASRPGSGLRPPHDVIQLQSENAKLRELCQLLQEKLDDAQMRQDEY